jgi:hypothetical protein
MSDDAWDLRVAEIRVPDWQCLLLKLEVHYQYYQIEQENKLRIGILIV